MPSPAAIGFIRFLPEVPKKQKGQAGKRIKNPANHLNPV
jgi:hypothetical protein